MKRWGIVSKEYSDGQRILKRSTGCPELEIQNRKSSGEEVSLSYRKKNHEGNAKEPFYALIVHLPQRMPSTNSTENDYENVGPKYKRPKPPDHKHETEYAILKIPSNPQPSHSLEDEEYELVMPVIHDSYP
ncbi:germinal center-associated signaling and motility protein isoform 2-T2 [Sarcophilus harrisii]